MLFLPAVICLSGSLLLAEGVSIIERPSPNQDERLIPQTDMVLIVASSQNCSSLLRSLTDLASEQSFHYVVCGSGKIYRLVPEDKRAWFASKYAFWHGRNRINDWSIGIVTVGNTPDIPEQVAALVCDIRTRYLIPDVNIIGQNDVFVNKATSAQPDWRLLGASGVGIFPPESAVSGGDAPASASMLYDSYLLLKAIGYKMSPQGATTQSSTYNLSMSAFQARFIPDGAATKVLTVQLYKRIQDVHELYMKEYSANFKCRATPDPLAKPPPNISFNSTFTSKNQNGRLYGPPFMIVLHNTELDLDLSLKTLVGNTSREVSAHYLVSKLGVIYQLVPESHRAWQAGLSDWGGYHNLNGLSIGIEIVNENSAKLRYTDAQIQAVINLIKDIRTRYRIPDEFILSHEGIAPTRRSDPGRFFPWSQLASNGIGLWYEQISQRTNLKPFAQTANATARSMLALARIGYPVDNTTTAKDLALVVQKFQWRFMPSRQVEAKGALDKDTIKRIGQVEQAYLESYQRKNLRNTECWEPISSGASGTVSPLDLIIIVLTRIFQLLFN